MNFKEKRSFNENGVQGRVYETDDSFTADRLINLLTQLETDRAKLFVCYCNTFNDDGRTWNPRLYSTEELSQIRSFPNSSLSVRAVYINRETEEYEFEVSTAINSNTFTYKYDQSKKDEVKNDVELRKMIETRIKEFREKESSKTNNI